MNYQIICIYFDDVYRASFRVGDCIQTHTSDSHVSYNIMIDNAYI